MFQTTRNDGVLELRRPDTEWLSTGWAGGRSQADAAHSVSVPEGWHPDDLEADIERRVRRAGFARDGPVLVTGVDAVNARGARCGTVEAYATAGISNPAALPMDPPGGDLPDGRYEAGTVNVVVGTTMALENGALANLVAVATEAKAATLLHEAGIPGTTTDAVIAACDPTGLSAEFSGSATPVGAAARACVREAVRASLAARYDGDDVPTVETADYPVSTDVRAEVFEP